MITAQQAAVLAEQAIVRKAAEKQQQELQSIASQIESSARSGVRTLTINNLFPETIKALQDNGYLTTQSENSTDWVIITF